MFPELGEGWDREEFGRSGWTQDLPASWVSSGPLSTVFVSAEFAVDSQNSRDTHIPESQKKPGPPGVT